MHFVRPIGRLLRTATFRLAALYLGVFALSALLLAATVFVAARGALDQQMSARIEAETAFLHDEYRAGGRERLLATVRTRSRVPNALDYLLQDPHGITLAGGMPTVAGPLPPGWTTVNLPDDGDAGDQAERVRVLVSMAGGLRLTVGDDLGRVAEVEHAIETALLWTLGLAALLGIGGGAWLSRAFLARVDAIARTAQAIIGGDLARRVPVRGTGDDLDRLAGTLNQMLDRIAMLMDSLRQVSSDVAHDLRTPLSRLRQRLEDARLHARSPPEFHAALDGAIPEADALLETFSALLRIAQVEGGSARSGFSDVDLTGVMEGVVDAYRPDAEEAGHVLSASIARDVTVHGDQELLTQAAANLVENALRHTPPGTSIGVRLTGQRCLIVEDDGPGVRSADLPLLARRFYRGERSRTTPGNGLGLSLVAAVAELHDAVLSLESASPGLRIRLCFGGSRPPAPPPAPTPA